MDKNLKNGIVTEEMLEAALYSCNKRAKNCRDKKREYKRGYDPYDNETKYAQKEAEYYEVKEHLLSYAKPVCVHKEFAGFPRVRHYDYEKGFSNLLVKSFFGGKICHSGSFVRRDRSEYDCWDEYEEYENEETVYFADIEDSSTPEYRYYLYYRFGNHSFHTPIEEKDVKGYDLPVVMIDTLNTEGRDVNDLCSTAFVKAVCKCLENGGSVEVSPYEEFVHEEMCEEMYESDHADIISDSIEKRLSENLSESYYFWNEYIESLLKKEISRKKNILENQKLDMDEVQKETEAEVRAFFENLKSRMHEAVETLSAPYTPTGKQNVKNRRKKISKALELYSAEWKWSVKISCEEWLLEMISPSVSDFKYDFVPLGEISISEAADMYLEDENNTYQIVKSEFRRKFWEENKQSFRESYLGEDREKLRKLKEKVEEALGKFSKKHSVQRP